MHTFSLTPRHSRRNSFFSVAECMKVMLRSLVISAYILSLSACSLFRTEQETTQVTHYYDWQKVEQQLKALTHWSLLGKLGVRTEAESMTVAINKWEQADDQFEIDLSSTFFGLGSSKLFGSSAFLSIFQPGEETLSSFEPDKLIEAALGIPLPISHLSSWIKALPVADISYQQRLNPQGLPEMLIQDNWTLNFSQYRTDYSPPLPGKIKLQNKNTRIILAVKEWTLP